MKKIMKFWISAIIALSLQSHASMAQSIDADRMKRDIEVAENVLATLIKHEMSQQQAFFGMDVRGSYQPGHGVTFRLPPDHFMPFGIVSFSENEMRRAAVIAEGNGYRYSISSDGNGRTNGSPHNDAPGADDAIKLKEKSELSADSIRAAYNERVILAAKNFILDYGDFISQLAPNEKIVVTNQGDQHRFFFNTGKRTRISVEGTRADVTAFRQGKVTRDQAAKKLTVLNTESLDTREPDMEMLSSIFSRLYRPDLSKTYFIDGNVYYERLKDFGTIFYMQMVSSMERNLNRFAIPTLQLENLTQEERDKKVAELYPAFEREIKQNILEYGRTVKSLKDDESLIFNISLTRCTGCGIPSTLELGIKSSILKDFGAGKIDQNAAMKQFTIKRGTNQ
jgi:hypothetical protein